MDNQGISNQNGDRSRILPDPPVENTSEIDTETSPLKAWLLRGMNKHGKAHWADCREYYNEYQPTVAELDKSFRPPKPDQMRLALSIITSLPGQLEDLVRAVNEIRSFERTFIRVMKGLTPACVLYAKLLLNGVYECLRILREETTASGQAEKQFNKIGEEEKFYPQLESHVVTWMTSMLPSYVVTRAHNRKAEPSARIFLTEYYFSLFPQPGEQARHLCNLAQKPTTVSENPTDVLNNIENWRTTIQKLYELTNWIPIQEDIKTAFASLTAPVLTNIPSFDFQWNFIETISYPSINTTDAQVHKYITGIVEEIHELPKSTKWERTEEAYEAYPQEEGYEEECSTLWPKTAQEQGYVEEADEGSDDGASEDYYNGNYHEEVYGPYNEEACQEETYEEATMTKPITKKKVTTTKPMTATTTKPIIKKKAMTKKPITKKKVTTTKPMTATTTKPIIKKKAMTKKPIMKKKAMMTKPTKIKNKNGTAMKPTKIKKQSGTAMRPKPMKKIQDNMGNAFSLLVQKAAGEATSANTGTIVTQIRVNHSRHQAKIGNGTASLADGNRYKKFMHKKTTPRQKSKKTTPRQKPKKTTPRKHTKNYGVMEFSIAGQ